MAASRAVRVFTLCGMSVCIPRPRVERCGAVCSCRGLLADQRHCGLVQRLLISDARLQMRGYLGGPVTLHRPDAMNCMFLKYSPGHSDSKYDTPERGLDFGSRDRGTGRRLFTEGAVEAYGPQVWWKRWMSLIRKSRGTEVVDADRRRPVPTLRQVGPAFLIAAVFAAVGIVGVVHGVATSDLVQLGSGSIAAVGGIYLLFNGLRAWRRILNDSRGQ